MKQKQTKAVVTRDPSSCNPHGQYCLKSLNGAVKLLVPRKGQHTPRAVLVGERMNHEEVTFIAEELPEIDMTIVSVK
jgi:hypothetical protein